MSYDVIVIGAGPSGLSCGYYLNDKCKYIILEMGSNSGNSWTNMPDNISLISPWYVNSLPGTFSMGCKMFKQHTRLEFSEYLKEYSNKFKLNVSYGKEVLQVEKENGKFVVKTKDNNVFISSFIINCTGYFFNPKFPDKLNDYKLSIPYIHVQEFKNPNWLSENFNLKNNKVLVVGTRVSGGQTATELKENGFNVWLSFRTKIKFSREQYIQKLVYIPYYIIEFFQSKFFPNYLEDTNPPMEGGKTKKFILNKEITVVPEIEKEKDECIYFVNGVKEKFDIVVFCTGFLPVVKHLTLLKKEPLLLVKGESRNKEGLFFIGVDKQFTFRSRYLRGIREDAKVVSDIIIKRIEQDEI